MKFLDEFSHLIFPSRCIACNELGPSICTPCRRLWNQHIYHRKLPVTDGIPLLVYSSISYSHVAQKVLLAAKESAIKAADTLLVEALIHATYAHPLISEVQALIPIPSRFQVTRKRGRFFMGSLTQTLSQQVRIPVHDVLIHNRAVRDQSGLELESRRNNLKEAFVVRPVTPSLTTALLVDDLVTSGATLVEGARALESAGVRVIGAVTACAAEPLRLAHLT